MAIRRVFSGYSSEIFLPILFLCALLWERNLPANTRDVINIRRKIFQIIKFLVSYFNFGTAGLKVARGLDAKRELSYDRLLP